jgi:peptidoglycan/xylan/chitin deacetylase (PgdA/CDA1 family)
MGFTRSTRFSRRAFLEWAALIGAGGLLRENHSAWVRQRMIPVPPSIMLHARQDHLDNLARLIGWLRAEGFTLISYRELWEGLTGGAALPAAPVILSIDDLVLVRGSNNFAFIERMVAICQEKNAPVVVGINTEPIVFNAQDQPVQLIDQDDDLWNRARGWVSGGVELATHTQTHKNLTDPALSVDDFQREIGGSAQMIADRTGQPVITLVLPYGSGTVGYREGPLYAPIADECRRAGIGMVVGVAGGRAPLIPRPASESPLYLVGRVGPVRDRFDTIYGDITYWRTQNAAFQPPPIP